VKKTESLLPKHGGYRKLKSFQVAELAYDITVRFCDAWIDRRSRTHDQMVQAARSGVQNIVEGSLASGTSKKMELKLTNIARASLEELRRDYEDFLRQRGMEIWPAGHPLRAELIALRPKTADGVALWVKELHRRPSGPNGPDGPFAPPTPSTSSTILVSALAANAALTLVVVACSLLDRQVAALAESFEKEGGFTERLYRIRQARRRSGGG